jgi:hypothetical protein
MRNVEFHPGLADACCDSMWNGSLNSGVYDKMKGDETACGKITVVRRNLRCRALDSQVRPICSKSAFRGTGMHAYMQASIRHLREHIF